MMFLLNRERVFNEMMTLVRLEIAEVLKIKPSEVEVLLELDPRTNQIVPSFRVGTEAVEGPDISDVREVMAAIFSLRKPELRERLQDLTSVWEHYVWEKETRDAQG